MDMYNLCRLCALEKAYQIPIFTETVVDIALRIEKIVQVTVTVNDPLPKTICTECLAFVNNYYDFLVKCNQAQFVLKALCNNIKVETKDEVDEFPNQIEIQTATRDSGDEFFAPVKEIEELNDHLISDFIEIHVLPDGSLLQYTKSNGDEDFVNDNDENEIIIEDSAETEVEYSPPLNDDCISLSPTVIENEVEKQFPTRSSDKRKCKLTSTSTITRKTRPIFRQLQCYKCNVIKRGPKQLQLHFRIIHRQNVVFICPTCSKQFGKYRSFTRHVILHKEGPQFACEICNKTFAQKVQLLNHIRIHTNKPDYQCKECGKKYRHITSLYRHVRHHSGYKVVCGICSREFMSTDSLRSHEKAFHMNERNEICRKCGLTFTTRPALYYHMKFHENNISGKEYVCSVCDKEFSTYLLLQQHHTTHIEIEIENMDDKTETVYY